jgi:hypothetical protein
LVTIDDSGAFSRAFALRFTGKHSAPGDELKGYICEENNSSDSRAVPESVPGGSESVGSVGVPIRRMDGTVGLPARHACSARPRRV